MLEEALQSSGYPVAYAGWSHAPKEGGYLVYLEDGANDLVANGRHVERCTRWTVDLFLHAKDVMGHKVYAPESADGYEDTVERLYMAKAMVRARRPVEDALNSINAAWYFNSAQYESDTGLLHFEWVVESDGDD